MLVFKLSWSSAVVTTAEPFPPLPSLCLSLSLYLSPPPPPSLSLSQNLSLNLRLAQAINDLEAKLARAGSLSAIEVPAAAALTMAIIRLLVLTVP